MLNNIAYNIDSWIFLLLQRMVYPEKLNLDQVVGKSPAQSSSSWCSEPLERNSNNINLPQLYKDNFVNKSNCSLKNDQADTTFTYSNDNGPSQE